MINEVILTGRLVRDIEVRYTKDNVAVGNITLAVQRKFKNANGEYDTDFINCTLYKIIAEKVKEFVHKGDMLGVVGRIQTRNYEDKDGNKRVATNIMVDKITFLSSKKENKSSVESDIKNDETVEEDPYAAMGEEISDEDLPF